MLPSKAISLLKDYGVNAVGKLVSLGEALSMPRPIVLKADTEEHKTEKNLVFLGLKTDEEIREAYEKIKGYGVIAQPFIKGYEFIAGALQDETFGKVIMIGAGGIFAEIFEDVSFRAIPLKREDVEEMIGELKIGKIFEGYRGIKLNKRAFVENVLALSKFAEENEFKELDLNPIIVNEEGAFAVDVRLVI